MKRAGYSPNDNIVYTSIVQSGFGKYLCIMAPRPHKSTVSVYRAYTKDISGYSIIAFLNCHYMDALGKTGLASLEHVSHFSKKFSIQNINYNTYCQKYMKCNQILEMLDRETSLNPRRSISRTYP